MTEPLITDGGLKCYAIQKFSQLKVLFLKELENK